MRIILDTDNEQNFVDLWNPEKNNWERYVKVTDEVAIIEDKKIEKEDEILTTDDLDCPITYNEMKIWKQVIKEHNRINEIIDKINSMEVK